MPFSVCCCWTTWRRSPTCIGSTAAITPRKSSCGQRQWRQTSSESSCHAAPSRRRRLTLPSCSRSTTTDVRPPARPPPRGPAPSSPPPPPPPRDCAAAACAAAPAWLLAAVSVGVVGSSWMCISCSWTRLGWTQGEIICITYVNRHLHATFVVHFPLSGHCLP